MGTSSCQGEMVESTWQVGIEEETWNRVGIGSEDKPENRFQFET